jgi:hypothetical protein
MADPLRAILIHYDVTFREHHDGWPAPIQGAKDVKLIKKLRATYTDEQIRALIDHYFVIRDPFIAKGGYTFGVFYACIGKILIDYQRSLRTKVRELQRREDSAVDQAIEWSRMSPDQKAALLR